MGVVVVFPFWGVPARRLYPARQEVGGRVHAIGGKLTSDPERGSLPSREKNQHACDTRHHTQERTVSNSDP